MWTGIRMSDKKGVGGCCEDWEKAGDWSWVRRSGGMFLGRKNKSN